MPATKEQTPKAKSTGGLDEYIQSMQAYLAKVDRDRDNSPELCRTDLLAIRQHFGNMKLHSSKSLQLVSSSPKKNYAK